MPKHYVMGFLAFAVMILALAGALFWQAANAAAGNLSASVIAQALAAQGIAAGSLFPVPVNGIYYHVDRLRIEDRGNGEFVIFFKASSH